MRQVSIQKMTRLAMLLALGVLLNYAEVMLLPTAIIAPGVKLGIANAVGLIVLYYFGAKDYVYLGFLRILMTSLFTGFGFNFIIASSGWLIASLAVVIAQASHKFSLFGLSILGASMHSLGQVMMVSYLYQSIFMLNYLPILLVTSVIAGTIIALLSQQVIMRIPYQSVI
jgi:heptaprenyl diphosphate synthase